MEPQHIHTYPPSTGPIIPTSQHTRILDLGLGRVGRGPTPPEGRSPRGHPGAPRGQLTRPRREACEIYNICCNLFDEFKQTAITAMRRSRGLMRPCGVAAGLCGVDRVQESTEYPHLCVIYYTHKHYLTNTHME